jgi:exosome complex RNA-binding protein Rrp4
MGALQEVFSMRIKGQADIEIFISDNGYICLKQQRDTEEQLIELAPAYGAKVADAIGSLQEFAQAKFQKAELVED